MMRIIPNAIWYRLSAAQRWRLRCWRSWGKDWPTIDDRRQCYDYALLSMARMPRTVFLLHCLDELSYPDIGGRLHIDGIAVKHHLAEALIHIDRVLYALYPDQDWLGPWPDDD